MPDHCSTIPLQLHAGAPNQASKRALRQMKLTESISDNTQCPLWPQHLALHSAFAFLGALSTKCALSKLVRTVHLFGGGYHFTIQCNTLYHEKGYFSFSCLGRLFILFSRCLFFRNKPFSSAGCSMRKNPKIITTAIEQRWITIFHRRKASLKKIGTFILQGR